MRKDADISWTGEFASADAERAFRRSQAAQEVRQMRLLWSLALVCFLLYAPADLANADQAGAAMLGLRVGIILIGVLVLLAVQSPAGRRHRDALTGLALLLALCAYGAIVGLRPGTATGALTLLLVGSYLFSPCRFALHVATGALGTVAAVGCALVPGGPVDWLEMSYLLPANLLAASALAQVNRWRRRMYWQGQELKREIDNRRRAQRRLAAASRQNLRLLYNALPRQVAKELQEKPGNPVARELPEVAILFADIVGFSRLARRLSPAGLVEFLNLLFSSFDRCSAHFGVEKIKTIGDAYLAVAGVSAPDDATENAAHLALCLREEAARLSARLGFRISLRSGLHTGPVVAGVLGTRRFAFDVWGESVNIASRLQAAAPVDGILVSADARTRCSPSLRFGPAEEFDLRGCGRVSASVLKGRSTIAQLAGNRSGRIFR